MAPSMTIPADLRRRIHDELACSMVVPPEWCVRAAIEHFLALSPEDQVDAVERVRDARSRRP